MGAKKGHKPWNKDNPEASERMMGENNPFYGKHHTEETKKFLSERVFSKETRKRMSEAKKGKKLSKEHSQKIALGNTGKRRTEEVKKKMSAGKMGEKNPFYGKKHTPESKKKISEQTTGENNPFYGKQHTEEFKSGLSEARTGKTLGKDNPFFGKTHTEENKEIIRQTRMHTVMPKVDSKIEKTLQGLLKRKEINFEKHKPILGQPDIFIKPNVCIFADGDYWHGWLYLQGEDYSKQKKFNNTYFENKIRRDVMVTEQLTEEGYTVLRFWEHEIEKDPGKCLQEIIKIIKESKSVLE